MSIRLKAMSLALVTLAACAVAAEPAANEKDDSTVADVRKSAATLETAFNAGKVDEITDIFLPKGEVIDEKGTEYQGHKEIKDLLTSFFEKFPGAQLSIHVESVRVAGPVAIDEGTRTITTKDGAAKSQFRYISVWAKADDGWKLASIRDFTDDPPATPHDNLQPIAWMAGDWINEGADGKVAISYHWSEDKNYLLGQFEYTSADGTAHKSSQRIGWDPSVNKIHSWLFDADGGFAEGYWTVLDDEIVVKSSTVNPDGTMASATMTIARDGKDRFSMAGTDRIVGDDREPDFKIMIVRRPPVDSK